MISLLLMLVGCSSLLTLPSSSEVAVATGWPVFSDATASVVAGLLSGFVALTSCLSSFFADEGLVTSAVETVCFGSVATVVSLATCFSSLVSPADGA